MAEQPYIPTIKITIEVPSIKITIKDTLVWLEIGDKKAYYTRRRPVAIEPKDDSNLPVGKAEPPGGKPLSL